MYQDNEVFINLKNEYSTVTTRRQIIDLFKEGKFHEGYLCTLVWGNIGLNVNARTVFNDAFGVDKESVVKRLSRVKEYLENGDIKKCCNYLCRGEGHFPGVGVSFFTKLMYFIGEAYQIPNDVRPLIYDDRSRQILQAIWNEQGVSRKATSGVGCYLAFNELMAKLSKELHLQSAGHLEALFFNDLWSLIQNRLR